ncbi:unnamed protein product, partial [Bemisia tabaci]
TACNRTYYGQVGRTYELEIRRPREDRLPLLCFLNFTAAGGSLGDLVQLTFDAFTVGRFVSFTMDGCPDGYMTIREEGRPDTKGQWCGSAWGYTVYYSETRSLNLSLNLFTLSDQGISGYNFDFKLSYKFLKYNEAHLRYGNSSQLSYRGELVQGSYCTRQLNKCDTRPCRVQSPNFPGIYPRNVTCYYRLEHNKVPSGKQALIAVRQRNSHKIHIKDQMVKYERSQRLLRVWDECNVVQDYLTVYDGGSTMDPVLVRLCGGDAVPDIISSGPDMLLEFHTSPYDNPFHPVPLSYLPGFELDVQIMYVEARSGSSSSPGGVSSVGGAGGGQRSRAGDGGRSRLKCLFTVSSFDSSWGLVENPRHSLPPNTTCFYQFQGRKDETVWLSFIKYHAASAGTIQSGAYHDAECNARLRIWDGRLPSEAQPQTNSTLIHEFCKEDAPKLCDHYFLSNTTRMTRPCSLSESYISRSQDLTLELFLRQGSVLYPINFLLRYEFVNTALEGARYNESGNQCDRLFKSEKSPLGSFRSPKSVFFYGRGGRRNVTCIFRFEPRWDEQVRIKLTRVKFGNRLCSTVFDSRIPGKQVCSREFHTFGFFNSPHNSTEGVSELWINEYPWAEEIKLPRHCVCSELDKVLTFTSLISSVIELNFTILNMNITEDYNDYFFEGEFNFVHIADADSVRKCELLKLDRRLSGTSGEITLPRKPDVVDHNSEVKITQIRLPEHLLCNNYPYLIQSSDSYLYLRVRGYELGYQSLLHWQDKLYQTQCSTKNRVVVYSVADSRDFKVVCPQDTSRYTSFDEDVQLFSKGWHDAFNQDYTILKPLERNFVVEFIGDEQETESYSIFWMQVSKRPDLAPAVSSRLSSEHTILDCPYRCPELNACISWTLWCDGKPHCPGGFDEEESNCAFQFGVSFLYITIGSSCLFILSVLLLLTLCIRSRSKEKYDPSERPRPPHPHPHGGHNHLHLNQNGDSAKHIHQLQTQLPSTDDLFIGVKDIC